MKVIVSTHDKYRWIIPLFFHFYRRYWPDNPYETEIITEREHIDGTVFYTGGVRWSSGIIKYLKQSKEDKFLMTLDDYLVPKIVNTGEVQRAEELCTGDVGSVNLDAAARYYKDNTIKCNIKGFREYPVDSKYSFSLGPVIYQKKFLLDVLQENESIWRSEVSGSRRLAMMKGKWRTFWADPPLIPIHLEDTNHCGSLMHKGTFKFETTKWALQELLNNNSLVFIDVGELGWSLYLSAHIRWRKKITDSKVVVITLPDRKCLYVGLADNIIKVPKEFGEKFNLDKQDSNGIRKVSQNEIKSYFASYVPDGYRFAEPREYPTKITSESRIFAPYDYKTLPENSKEILVFPRCRKGLWERGNLPIEFYSYLIKRLCDEFPELIVRSIGTKEGAYNIKLKRKSNYINWVGKGGNLQDFIDKCQSAIAAVGSQSAPPKLSLLQGVPTFMIGHQKHRHVEKENWMNTKVGFYGVNKNEYANIDVKKCTKEIVDFIRRVK